MSPAPPWRVPLDADAADLALGRLDGRLRVARPGDARALTGLLREWARDEWAEEPRDLARNMGAWLADPAPGFALLATHRGQPAGLTLVQRTFAPPEFVVQLVLDDLYVAKAARRHGLGRVLVDGVVALAPLLGAKHVSLTVRRDNPGARALYEAAGWESTDDVLYEVYLD
jgi:GNAT superfamily N-acetyltransferase